MGLMQKGNVERIGQVPAAVVMCLMCSDIILVEINYLGRSEGVSRKIPVARHELSSDT